MSAPIRRQNYSSASSLKKYENISRKLALISAYQVLCCQGDDLFRFQFVTTTSSTFYYNHVMARCPSTDKTSVVYPLQPLDRNALCNCNSSFFFFFFAKFSIDWVFGSAAHSVNATDWIFQDTYFCLRANPHIHRESIQTQHRATLPAHGNWTQDLLAVSRQRWQLCCLNSSCVNLTFFSALKYFSFKPVCFNIHYIDRPTLPK